MDLAEAYFPKEQVRKRWDEYLEYEAGVMLRFRPRTGRIH
jgi:hypothetical protein